MMLKPLPVEEPELSSRLALEYVSALGLVLRLRNGGVAGQPLPSLVRSRETSQDLEPTGRLKPGSPMAYWLAAGG